MQLFLASSLETTGPVIAKRILKQKAIKKAAFIYTAGEIEKDQGWIDDDRRGFNQHGITTFDYTLTGKSPADLENDLGGCDLIHVNGGNSFYLLLQAKKSGFDKFIKRQVNQGVIYTGSSAGSYIVCPDIDIFETLDHKDVAPNLPDTHGFGLIDIAIFPHWGSQIFKDMYLHQRLDRAYRTGHKIILLNDNQYVAVIDNNYKIIDLTKD